MPSLELLYGFFAATLVFAYVPGPALMYTTAQTLARGRRAGLWAAFGLHIGGYVHVIAAAAGLSALFHAVPVLYTAVKLVGAGYLVWLGIGMVRSAMFPTAHAASQQAISKSGARVPAAVCRCERGVSDLVAVSRVGRGHKPHPELGRPRLHRVCRSDCRPHASVGRCRARAGRARGRCAGGVGRAHGPSGAVTGGGRDPEPHR